MKSEPTVKRPLDERSQGATDWERVDALSDEEIEQAIAEDPDAAPLLDEEFFRTAELIMPETEKQRITIRLDRKVLEFFKQEGSGYQSRINAVLKAYMLRSLRDKRTNTP